METGDEHQYCCLHRTQVRCKTVFKHRIVVHFLFVYWIELALTNHVGPTHKKNTT